MTETENQDLRREMADIIESLEEAMRHVREGDFKSASILWSNGKKQADIVNIKLVKAQRFNQNQEENQNEKQ